MKAKETERYKLGVCGCFFLLCLLNLLLSVCIVGQVEETKLPHSVFYLTDYAEVITDENERTLEKILLQLEQRTEIEFRVVLVNTTGTNSSSAYSEKIFKDWRISTKSGKGILLLYVINDRQWQVRVSKDLEKELPNDLLQTIGQASSEEITSRGYNQGVLLAIQKLVDELGKYRGFSYAELALIADTSSDNPPPRPENPSPDPSYNIIKLAVGGAISLVTILIGVMVVANLFGSLFFWDKDINGNQTKAIAKTILYLAIYSAVIYYFWENLKFYLSFVRLLGEGVALFGSCLFPIVALLLFVLLLISLRYIGRYWASSAQAGKQVLNKPIIITLCLLLILLALPRSDVSIINSWADKTGVLTESTFWGGTSGANANTYNVDGFGRIRRLNLQGASINDLKELADIETLSALQNLDIRDTPLTGTLDFPALPALESLRLRGTQLTGLQGLEKLPQLKELDVEKINSDSIANLEQLPNLKSLSLSRCKIDDLSRLGNLRNLNVLWLEETDISDLTSLSGFRNLSGLSVAGTSVKDLRPIAHLPITLLDISNTGITNEEVKEIFKRPMLVINGKTKSSIEDFESGILKLDQKFVAPETRAFRWQVTIGLAIAALLIFSLPLLRPLKTYWIFLLQRIFRKTALGVIFVLFLLTLANINLPIYVTYETWNVAEKLAAWAAIAAVGWLILRPLLLLALETKALNASVWSVPARFLVRFIPLIVVFGPISYQVMFKAVISAATQTHLPNIIGLIFFSVIFVVPWIVLLLFVFIGVWNWKHKLRKLQELPISDSEAVIEISLRPTFLNSSGTTNLQIHHPNKEIFHTVHTTVPLAMLSRLPTTCSELVSASVITLRQQDLLNLKGWELKLIKEWTAAVYHKTWSPSWFVADWVETIQPPSTEAERNLASLDTLQQYMSGTEHRVKIKSTIFPLKGDEKIYQCFAANEVIDRQELEKMSFTAFIDTAFTPVSVLSRSLFGQTHLADRLDLIMRVAEISLAFFCLILITEYEKERENFSKDNCEKIDEGLRQAFKNPPTFAAWLHLLRTFTKRPETELSAQIKNVLISPPIAESHALRSLLEGAAGSEAVKNVSSTVSKRNDVLTLLNFVRNLLVAHGPTLERTSPELYRATTLATFDLLTSLPWSMVFVCKNERSKRILFKGLTPQERESANTEQKTGIFVHIKNGESEKIIDAAKYFFVPSGTNSVAMFIGEKGFFEPITGLRV